MLLKGEPFKNPALILIILITILSRFMYLHVFFQVGVHTCLLVYIGCVNSVKVYDTKKENDVETMTQKDAYMFPVIGSCVLFGLFLTFKFLNAVYVNILFHFYFSIVGLYTMACVFYEKLADMKRFDKMKNTELFVIPVIPFMSEKPSKINQLDIGCIALAAPIGISYFMLKNWTLNNILGIAFSIFGIENLMLGQFKVGFILLGLLFFYDIFWVFGTPVMVTVAKNLDGPIKLMFPKNYESIVNGVSPTDFNMIGLGDIVIPGVFVALMLRYDMNNYFKKNKSTEMPFSLSNNKYFLATMFGYTMGIVFTLGIMFIFKAAQPALLYLVPGCLGSSLICAYFDGKVNELWEFEEESLIKELKEVKSE
jgi:minor histocompatibility antigen H13